jgi:glycosyltransferase involved in cell wall biosynthesis
VAETLAEWGNEITIIGPPFNDGGQRLYEGSLGITVIDLKATSRGTFKSGHGALRNFQTILSRIGVSIDLFKKGLKTKADVYHCNEVDSWVVGIVLAIFTGSKVVFDIHEYYPSRVAEVISNKFVNQIVEEISSLIFYFLSLFSDALIFTNHYYAEIYKFRGVYTVVRNCVRKSDFIPLPTNENLLNKYKDRLIVLHIGPLREIYGMQALLDSLAYIQSQEILYLSLGGAPNDFILQVEDKGCSEQIEIKDYIPFKQMLEYLAIADIGISPLQPSEKNTIYSLARKILEYIAAGIPVIVSDFPGYRELVEKFELGLVVDPENPQEIAAAVNKLARDEKLRSQMGENAARAFEIELNWEMESRKLFELYEKLSTK